MSQIRFLKFIAHIVSSEVRNHRNFTLFFVANLTLGLFGFSLLDSFKLGVDHILSENSKSILGADMAVSSRQPLTAKEFDQIKKFLPAQAAFSQMVEMYSMVYTHGKSRLVNVRAIDKNFPFYGTVVFANPTIGNANKTEVTAALVETPQCWVYPELLEQLQITIGDKIQIGEFSCSVVQTVSLDPGTNLTGAALAPRIYLGNAFLPQTGLIKKGSTAWHTLLIKLPQGIEPEKIITEFRESFPDSQLNIRGHRDEAFSSGRIIIYLGDYLGLAAMVALFLSAIGSSFLFRSFIARKTREIATLQALGLPISQATIVYSSFVLFLGLLASLMALLLTALSLPAAGSILHALMNLNVNLTLHLSTGWTTLSLGTLASLLICLPTLLAMQSIRPAELFQEAMVPSFRVGMSLLALAPAALFYWLLAMSQSKSVRVGTTFVIATLAATAILFVFSIIGLFLLRQIRLRTISWRLAIRQLTRNPLRTSTAFLAIAIGTLVINIIPQLRSSLRGELLFPEKSKVPSFFMFDIQPEQVEPLKQLLINLDVPLNNISPMVRATLTAVNGETFQRVSKSVLDTRENEVEQRFRSRGMNLTYRSKISEDEEVINGRDFSDSKNHPSEISLEQRFADRLGLHLGDELTFDIQGVPIAGKVVNFRRVRWTSFQPNFFIQFAPGSLEDAPQTFLASIPKVTDSMQSSLQSKITETFPNISLIDVSRVIGRILETVEQMVWALQLMAAIAVAAGLLVLYSIARQQIYERRHEANLLRILGAENDFVEAMVRREFFVISFGATLLGASLSFGVSYAISALLFDGVWLFAWQAPALSCMIVVAISLLIARSSIRTTLAHRPQAILQQE